MTVHKCTQEENATGRGAPEAAQPIKIGPEHASTLQTLVELTRQIMHADMSAIVSFSQAGQPHWDAISGFHNSPDQCHDKILFQRADRPLEDQTSSDLLLLDDTGRAGSPLLSSEGIRSTAVMPLMARGERLGVLIAGYRSAHDFTIDEKGLLRSLAAVAALALDNSRLLETVIVGQKMWERTFDAIKCGVVVHDEQYRIVRCNNFAAEMIGMAPAQVIGRSWAETCAQLFGERAAVYYLDKVKDKVQSFEVPAESGARYLISVASLDSAGGQLGSVVTWNDVSEVSRMQEQLSRSKRLAMVGQLAAGIAHEVNNPLASIASCAEATLRDLRRSSAAVLAEERQWSSHLEEIVQQTLRCKSIMRGLLDLALQRRPTHASCDINELVARSLKLAERRANLRKVSYEMELDEQLGEIATDAGMVQQVLDNLLGNALDALEVTGGVIKVATSFDTERVTIDVVDSGQGIAPNQLARIFDPFYTTKETGKGSGLGLAISCTLAEAMGGALTVESKVGVGSRFRLWLPRRILERHGD